MQKGVLDIKNKKGKCHLKKSKSGLYVLVNSLFRHPLVRFRKDIGRRCLAYSDYMEIKRLINLKKRHFFMKKKKHSKKAGGYSK